MAVLGVDRVSLGSRGRTATPGLAGFLPSLECVLLIPPLWLERHRKCLLYSKQKKPFVPLITPFTKKVHN